MSEQIPSKFLDVTPSDTAALPGDLIGLYIGGAGTVKGVGRDGVTGTFVVSSGQYLTGNFIRVLFTGTTATSIVALRKA